MYKPKHVEPHDSKVKQIATVTALVAGAAVAAPAVPAHAATMTAWDCIAKWESGSRWHLSWGDADSTGGLQIQTRTWDDFGGNAYAPQAYQATEMQQIAVAEKILAKQGPGAWTTNAPHHCGLAWSGPNASYLRGGVNPLGYTPKRLAAPAPAPYAAKHMHTVVPGDTLFQIAVDNGMGPYGWPKLYAENRAVVGSNPDLIFPGEKLRVP